ncbi:MAG: hypothetical protein GDA42_09880 [Ekhidna sp.]|nr:hypothetical protein [Ekhidna sp.]
MKKFVLLLTYGLMLYACGTNELEFDNIEIQRINGIYGLPLGEISYTMRELLQEAAIQDDALQVGADSVYILTYTDNISYTAQDEFVQINDITGSGILTVPNSLATGVVTSPRTVTISDSYVQTYDAQEGEELDSVFYNGGELSVTVTSTANVSRVDFQFTFKNTLNLNTRNPIIVAGTLNSPGIGNAAEDLANHVTLLSETTNNEFELDFEVSFVLSAGQELMGNDIVTFDFTYGNQSFSVIYGKFGQNTVQVGDETIDFDFFSDLDEGILFGEPTLRFNFVNAIGIPLAIDFSSMYADDGAGGNQIFLEGPITRVNNLPEIAAAPDLNSTSETTIEITPSNSNIRSVLATSPLRIVFDVAGTSNYYDPDNSESNFIEPNNSITADVDLEIPLDIRLEDFQESFRFGLSGGLDISDVDSVFLRVVTLNGLPFSGSLAMEIQDENEQMLYTIPERVVVNTPFINVSGEVTDPNNTSVDIPLSSEAVDALGVGSFINMVLTINTPASQTSDEIFVKIRSDYSIQIKVGLGGQVDIGF